MHGKVNQIIISFIPSILAICPMQDAREGLGSNATLGTTAFENVAGTGGTGIHVSENQNNLLPTESVTRVYTSYSSSGSVTGSSGGCDGHEGLVVNHDGYTGFLQHALPGFHSLDYDLFGNGSLNRSYSKNLDGSFYGRTDDEPFINSLVSNWSFTNSLNTSSNLISVSDQSLNSNTKVQLQGKDGNNGGLSVGSLPQNGGGVKPNSASAVTLGGAVGQLSSSGATGKTFKFNQRSLEANLSDYSKFFTASKIFAFNPTLDGIYKVVLVSTTKEYHPQMKIVEINKGGGEKYVEKFGFDRENGMYSTRYALRKDREYLVEIGASEKIDFSPFANINTGGFIFIISAEKRSLQEILGQHNYRVSIYGKVGTVPLNQNGILELSGANSKKESAGMLDYSITPFFNDNVGSVTIFFHNESTFSNGLSSSAYEAAVVEFECHLTTNSTRVFEGIEPSARVLEFNIQARSACDLIDMLK